MFKFTITAAMTVACCLPTALNAVEPKDESTASGEHDAQATASRTSLKPVTNEAYADHPLIPVINFAYKRLAAMKEVDDYTCTLSKRERIEGDLKAMQQMNVKIRHANLEKQIPFAVYLQFEGPKDVAGREALFVQGENEDKIIVRRGGRRLAYLTTSVTPDGPLAMRDNRYPLTEIGIENLLSRLIDVAERDLPYGECQVQFFKNAKINEHNCTRIVVTHPVQRDHFLFHRVEIFVDAELQLPVRYVSYGFPNGSESLPLNEEYTYTNVKLNRSLTNLDFDADNPSYQFSQKKEVVE